MVTSTTAPPSTSNAAAAAAEAARQAAAAAEAARKAAAEAARQLQQQTARAQAAEAQKAAARTELAQARQTVQTATPKQKPAAREELEAAQTKFDRADAKFQQQVRATQDALRFAQRTTTTAARASQTAAVKAHRAGYTAPFSNDFSANAARLQNAQVTQAMFTKDAFVNSVGSLFGGQPTATNLKALAGGVAAAPVTVAQDRAALNAEVTRGIGELADANDESPRAAAEKLQELMESHAGNALYQQSLAAGAAPVVAEISKAVNSGDDRLSGDDLKGTLRGLSLAAAAAGRNGGQSLVSAFANDMVDDHLDIDDEDQFAGATRAVIEEGSDDADKANRAAFFQVLSQTLAAGDRNPEAQSEIDKAVDEALNGRPSTFENIAGTVDPVFDAAGDGLGWAGDRFGDVAPFVPDVPGPIDALNAVAGTNLPNPLSPHDLLATTDTVLNASGDVVQNVPEAAVALESATEYRAAIDGLGEDDTWSMSASAKGTAFFAELGIEGDISVSRSRDWVPVPMNEGADGNPLPAGDVRKTENGTWEARVAKPYTLTLNGEISAGVAGTLGADVNVEGTETGAAASARAGLQAGGQVELSFATADEAKHAMDVLAATAATGGFGPAAPIAAPVVNEVFDASPAELPSLIQDNVKAVEVRLGTYGEVSGGAGALEGVKASLGAQTDGVARVEFSDGKPTWLVTRLQGSATGAASGPLSAGGTATLNGALELRTPLADGFQLSDLAGVTSPLALTNADTRAHLSLSSDAAASAYGSGGGVRGELDAYGSPARLIGSGAFQRVLAGDWNGAVDRLDQGGLLVTGRVVPYTKTGVQLGFDAKTTGFGASGSFSVGTTNSGAPLVDFAANATTARRALDRAMEQLRMDRMLRLGRSSWAA